MTKQDIDDVFLMLAGSDSYLISIGDILTLMHTAADAGQPLIRVLDPDRCELMACHSNRGVQCCWTPGPVAMAAGHD